MEAIVEKVENNTAFLSIKVPPADVEQALDRAYRKIARNLLIPGFRKGKAPRALVERHIGRQTLIEEALEELVPEAYARAIEATGIEPIDRPEISDIDLTEQQELSLRATVDVKPEVALGDYRAISVERPQPEVKPEDVDVVLQQLRESQAQLAPIEDSDATAAAGHVVTIDFNGTIDGQPFDGGSGTDYQFELGSGRLLEDMESGITGMKVGEERAVPVTFPEDFHQSDLAGKEAQFTIVLKALHEKRLPELDAEFAASVGEFSSVEELRQDISDRLLQQATEEAENEVRQEVIRLVSEQAAVDLPEVLISRRINSLIQDFAQRLQAQGLSLEAYLAGQDETEQDLREQFRPRAEREVKADLVLEAIGRREQLEPDEADFAAEARRLAEFYGQPVEQIRRIMEQPDTKAEIRATLRIRKTVDFLSVIATKSDNSGSS